MVDGDSNNASNGAFERELMERNIRQVFQHFALTTKSQRHLTKAASIVHIESDETFILIKADILVGRPTCISKRGTVFHTPSYSSARPGRPKIACKPGKLPSK